MNKKVTAVAVGSAVLACTLAVPAYANDCNHSTHRTANSAGPDIKRVVVEAGAGDLVVRGGDSRDVKVEGKACASIGRAARGNQAGNPPRRRHGVRAHRAARVLGWPVRLCALCVPRRDRRCAEDRDAQARRLQRRHARQQRARRSDHRQLRRSDAGAHRRRPRRRRQLGRDQDLRRRRRAAPARQLRRHGRERRAGRRARRPSTAPAIWTSATSRAACTS